MDGLLDSRPNRPSITRSVASMLLYGFTDSIAGHSSSDLTNLGKSQLNESGCMSFQYADSDLHCIALRNAMMLLQQLESDLISSMDLAEHDLIYREISIRLRDIGFLLVTCVEPTIIYAFLDVPRLLVFCIHLIAICGTNSFSIVTEDILESVTYIFGALVSSHVGVREVASAFENISLEQAWFNGLLGEASIDHSIIKELRHRPGVLALAEEIQKSSKNIAISPPFTLSKLDIGIATATLLDGWRISQVILQLQLGDTEHVRRHLETVSQSCLSLAQMCAYDCGREVQSCGIELIKGFMCCSYRYRITEFPYRARETLHVAIHLRGCEIFNYTDISYRCPIPIIVICGRGGYTLSSLSSY